MAIKPWMAAAIVGGAAATAGAAWFATKQMAFAEVAVGYAAKQTCSCLFVSGRTMSSCMDDFPADARSQLSIEPAGDTVTATALFGAFRSEAVFEEGLGCRAVR